MQRRLMDRGLLNLPSRRITSQTFWQLDHSRVSRLDVVLLYSAVATLASAVVALLLSASVRPSADYQVGDKFARVAGLGTARSSAAIVIFLNTNCGACQESAGVFQRVARLPRRFQVFVIGYEGEDLLRQFVETSAIQADAVESAPLGTVRFATVPRLAVLDRAGIIKAMWSGAREITAAETDIVAIATALSNF